MENIINKTQLISDFIKESGFKPGQTKAEIKSLHEILMPDETPIDIVEGFLKHLHNKEVVGIGVVLLTNKRFLFYRKSFLGTITREEFPLYKISSASYRKGLMWASIHIYAANSESVIEQCDSKRAKNLVDNLQQLLHNNIPLQTQTTPPNKSDSISDIKKWFELKEQGIISQEEFEGKKKQIMGL